MQKIHSIARRVLATEPCPHCGRSSLLMQTDSSFHAVWCCPRVKKNQILAQLRRNGWDIGSQYFQKKVKRESQPPVNKRILGKFADEAALEKALYSLANRMDIPEEVIRDQVSKIGLVVAYRRLQVAFSRQRSRGVDESRA